jgi:hypothetical protein
MVKPLAGLLTQSAYAVKTEGKTVRVWGPFEHLQTHAYQVCYDCMCLPVSLQQLVHLSVFFMKFYFQKIY